MSLYVGVDIGGTKIASGLVDESGEILEMRLCSSDANLGGQHVLETAVSMAEQVIAKAKEPIVGIGIGAGGQIDADSGVVISATSVLPGWGGIDIATAFKERFGVIVAVDNDVNALAHGELRFGAAKGMKTAVFLALGTGVGGAIVIDGKIHHGAHWCGGELGHIIIDSSETARVDIGGAKGTLEAYCCGHGLLQTYIDLGGPVKSEMTASDIKGGESVTKTGEYLGIGLTTIANMIDPEIIVIGGGLSNLGDLLLDPARKALQERALPIPSKCPVAVSSLGKHASVIGAASLAMAKLT